MSMGYGSNFADVIEEKHVEEICPKEYKAFKSLLQGHDVDLYNLANYINYDYGLEMVEEDDIEKIIEAWDKLREAFENQTNLRLYIERHDTDNDGSCYDDVDGGFFTVDGMYKLTPAGKKMGDKVQRKFWVTFG